MTSIPKKKRVIKPAQNLLMVYFHLTSKIETRLFLYKNRLETTSSKFKFAYLPVINPSINDGKDSHISQAH